MYIVLCFIGLYRIFRCLRELFVNRDSASLAGRCFQLLRLITATSLWLLAVPCSGRLTLVCTASILDFGFPLVALLPRDASPQPTPFCLPAGSCLVPWGPWPVVPVCQAICSALVALCSCAIPIILRGKSILCRLLLLCCRLWPFVGSGPVRRPHGSSRSRGHGRSARRLDGHACGRLCHPWKTVLLLYLVGVDARTLHVGCSLWHVGVFGGLRAASSFQLYAHGFHEGRPVFSTGPVPTTSREEDLCEVLPLGRPGNHLLTPSRRPRRQVAMFLGRSGGEPDLEPCPIIFSVDERLHGDCLHRRLLLSVGAGEHRFTAFSLHSALPGLPSEQLLFTPADLGWNSVRLPVDLRPVGGRISLLRCARDDTCSRLFAAAMDHQGIFRPAAGILGRCCWGWFSLASQPLLAPGVDTLQFLPGPDPHGLQPLFGTTLEPPVSLQTNMQVSTLPSPPPHEIFQGFSANHAVLITPNGLVYVEVPVFADAATYRRLVSLQADPPSGGGIMRLWQPLPLLPHVQFLEIHCTAAQVPCVLDFRPMGWRIMTVCAEQPVTACSALQAAFDSGADIPEAWIEDCLASRIGVLHKERAVRPSAPLLGGPPFVLLFFPHIFVADESSSDRNVGGGEVPQAEHTVLPPLGGEAGGRTPTPAHVDPDPAEPDSLPSTIAAGARYEVVPDDDDTKVPAPDPSAGSPRSQCRWIWLLLLLTGSDLLPGSRFSLCLQAIALVDAVQVHSAPASPREVVLAPAAALDSARLATPSAHRRLQSLWQHFGDFGQGSLWPVPGSTANSLRFSIKLWHPEHSYTVEFLGNTDAKAAAAEVWALASRTSRSQVFAAAGGMPAGQVHLVAAPRDRSHVSVFFDAGIEVWCVDVPRHTNSEYLLHVACSLASTDALQISSSVSTPLRNGDVLGIRLEVDPVEVDLSEHVLARPGASAATWLDPVRYFTLLTAASGATTYQIARSAEVDVHLLKGLVRHVEGPGGTFLELPYGALLRRPIWVHCAPDLDHVVFRITEAWDPHDDGLFFVFRGTFPSYADFVRSLRQDPSPRAQWLRAIRPFGTTVLSWEYTQLLRHSGFSLWVVHCSVDIARAQFHHVRYISRQPPIINLRAPHPWPRAQRQISRGIQTDAAQEHLLQGAAIWQTIPRPLACELGRYPEIPSALDNLWCTAWQIRCVVPCIPGYLLWAIRDGDRLLGMCTASITWDLVASALHISMWELPQTFLHGEGAVWPYPQDLSTVAHRCVSLP